MKIPLFLGALFCCLPLSGAEEAKATFPQAGFSITPPDGPLSDRPLQVITTFLLPSEGNFANNIVVIVVNKQPDFKAFLAQARKEVEPEGMKLIVEKQPTPESWVVETSGTMQGVAMHTYHRALWKNGRVYMVHATVAEGEWAKLSAKAKACVDSIK